MKGQDDKKSEDRQRFYFYLKWADVIADEPDEVRLGMFDAIVHYFRTGEVPPQGSRLSLAFKFVKDYMDRDSKFYDNKCKNNSKAGKKGAASRYGNKENVSQFTSRHDTADVPSMDPDEKARECQDRMYPSNEEEMETERPTTEEEVLEYMHTYTKDMGISVDVRNEARKFMDYYDANGWLTTRREPIRNWRAVVRNWFNNKKALNHGNDKQEQARLENERNLEEVKRRFDERERYKREHGEEELPY